MTSSAQLVRTCANMFLVTPVCEASLLGYNGSLLFVGPYSVTALRSRPLAGYSGGTQSSTLVSRPSSFCMASPYSKQMTACKSGCPAHGREISVETPLAGGSPRLSRTHTHTLLFVGTHSARRRLDARTQPNKITQSCTVP